LDSADIGHQLVVGEQQPVTNPKLGLLLPGEDTVRVTRVDDGILRLTLGLSFEQASYCCDGVELKCLVGVKLKLYRRPLFLAIFCSMDFNAASSVNDSVSASSANRCLLNISYCANASVVFQRQLYNERPF
jgi:hypothetical protein